MSIDSILLNLNLSHKDSSLMELQESCPKCEGTHIGLDEELRLYCLDEKKEIKLTNSKEGQRQYYDLLLRALIDINPLLNQHAFDLSLWEKLVDKIEAGYLKLLKRNPLARDYYAISQLYYHKAVALIGLGRQQEALKAFEKCIEACKKMLELSPEEKYFHHASMKATDAGFFLTRFEQDHSEKILDYFKSGVKWAKDGLELAKKSGKAQNIQKMTQALPWPLLQLAIWYENEGDLSQALKLCNETCDLLPEDPMEWIDIDSNDARFLSLLVSVAPLFKSQGEEEKARWCVNFAAVLSEQLWKKNPNMINLTSYAQFVQKEVIDALDAHDFDEFEEASEKYIELFTKPQSLEIYKKEGDSLLQMLMAPVMVWSGLLIQNGKRRIEAELLQEVASAIEELYKAHPSAYNRYVYFLICKMLAENFMERNRVKKVHSWIYEGLKALNVISKEFPEENQIILANQMRAIELQRSILPYLEEHMDKWQVMEVLVEVMAILAETDSRLPVIDPMALFERYWDLIEVYTKLGKEEEAAYWMAKAVDIYFQDQRSDKKSFNELVKVAKKMMNPILHPEDDEEEEFWDEEVFWDDDEVE